MNKMPSFTAESSLNRTSSSSTIMSRVCVTTMMLAAVLLAWAAAASPAFSQKPIIYNRPNVLGGLDVFIANADGSGEQRIPVNMVTAEIPVWSRDGRLIAATGEVPEAGDQANTNIFVFDPTGANLRKVTNFVVTPYQDPVPLFKAFSPDKQKLAFVLFERKKGAVLLIVKPLDGAELTYVMGGAIDEGGWGVDWSPIQDLLIVPIATIDWSSGSPLPVMALFTVPPIADAAPYRRQVTFPRGEDFRSVGDKLPAFSRDGGQVAFVREVINVLDETVTSSIRVVKPDGTNDREVITLPGEYVTGLSWSPEGTVLVFDRGEVDSTIPLGSLGVWTVNLDGSGLTRVQAPRALSPSWSWGVPTAPSVTSFQINNGAASTSSRTVTQNNTTTGSPNQYMASESSGFSGAVWQTYAAAPSFVMSVVGGTKTIYFKVRNSTTGVESSVVSDTIALTGPAVTSFSINNGAASTSSRTVTLNNTATGSPNQYMASESSGFSGAVWQTYSTAPNFTLASIGGGTKYVYFKVRNSTTAVESTVVSDTIEYTGTAPIATAGLNQTVRNESVVTLDGSRSFDPDGKTPIAYKWHFSSLPGGSKVLLSNARVVNPTFIPDMPGDYKIKLIVKNSRRKTSIPVQVTISTVNSAPIADAGTDQSISVIGAEITLDGTQSYDPDGDVMTYQWKFISKPDRSELSLKGADTAEPTFEADKWGEYVIELSVSDTHGQSSTDIVTISFENVMPVADAGVSKSVRVEDMVTLEGKGTDANGDDVTYRWVLASVPEGSKSEVADPTRRTTNFVPAIAGTYVVQLFVNDGTVDSDPSTVQIQAVDTLTAAIQAVQDCEAEITSLDSSVFKNANMQNTLINKLNAVIAKIEAGNYADALGQLQNDVLKKTDGCATQGAPDKNDWIKNCDAQGSVYPCLLHSIEMVEALM